MANISQKNFWFNPLPHDPPEPTPVLFYSLMCIKNTQFVLKTALSSKYKADMRGLRAYFVVKDPAMQARTFVLSFDDQTTLIVPLRQDSKELDTNAPMYDLLGQQVSSSYRGIVIQNGKKFVVK